ncbi:hypothetical protein SSP531S_13870 [Streptomyces spongiicola]|uniref:Sulfatase n=1 Tax=Streptomyces spongiicola TaxID=1690221 RepID=A0A2S1YXC0_9ACTN|nr:hypothetical protein [Streptomyces spongiicola]AWK08716.1 hypothetical protein DDQ41_07035 [Streptomyces spongiicola]GBP99981.1 hypothetical protein SSP531S_13870 [Streptomyces spongiicola]
MSGIRRIRLLPWPGPEGNPAHLVTDGTSTMLSRLADRVEAEQIETAAVLRDLALSMVVDHVDPTPQELLFITRRLCEAVTDLLKIAESRAARIPPYDEPDDRSTDIE